jgi:hypothetical protein
LQAFVINFCCVDTGSSTIVCELCGQQCYERADYNHHFKRRHLGHFNIQCSACGKGFWKTSALQQHTCFPELREEHIREQQEKEANALRQRDEIRAAMGLDDYGISVGNERLSLRVQKQKKIHTMPEPS